MNKTWYRLRASRFFTLMLLAMHSGSAQEILLVDRKWKEPARVVDSVNFATLQGGWFPLYKSDLDKTISILEGVLEKGAQEGTYQYVNAPIEVQGTQVAGIAGSKIFLKTSVGAYTTFMNLLTGEEAAHQKERKLYQLLDYLKNNRSVLQ